MKHLLRILTVGVMMSVGGLEIAAASHTSSVRLRVLRNDDGIPLPCAADPVCHNRWHPSIPPIASASPGDVVIFETRDALDNQVDRDSTLDDLLVTNIGRIHPLTGPVYVNGAEPGDVLEVEILRVDPGPDRFGWSSGSLIGLLRDKMPPSFGRWDLGQSTATSPDVPGVRIPNGGFAGVVGVAPSPGLLERILARERNAGPRFLGGRGGGTAFLLDPTTATPAFHCGPGAPGAAECLRTGAPQEFGGNMDIKATTAGTTLLLPCFIEGCNLSIGDVHYAQGDGEVTGTAIEMNSTVRVRLGLRKGEALADIAAGTARPAFDGSWQLKRLAPRRFHAEVGYPLKASGEIPAQDLGEAFFKPIFPPPLSDLLSDEPPEWIHPDILAELENVPEDLSLAARDALMKMIEYLIEEKGLTPSEAYILTGVAVDLRIGNVVDMPNSTVYAVLPLDIFAK